MTVQFSKTFVKQLRKAPPKVKRAFRKRLELFLKDPYHPLLRHHPLTGKLQGYRSINITGDWRAIFRFLDRNTVFFNVLGTHSQLYR